MARLQIIVDGDTKFDEDVENWQLPTRPESIRGAIPNQADGFTTKPAPWMKALMVVQLATLLERTMRDHPLLQPLDIDLQTRGTGYTLSVDIPAPSQAAIEA